MLSTRSDYFKDLAMNSSLSPRTAIGLFLIVVLAWGVNWSMTKQIVQFLPPLWTSAIRSWIALAGLFVILGLSNNLVIPDRRDIPVILSVAVLHMTIFSVLVAAGVRFLPASKAIVLGYTTPLWVAIAAPLLGKDTLTAPKLAGALLGLIGLAVILNPASIDWTNANVLLGAGMVILAAISWAANIIYIRAHRWIASPLQLLIWQVLVATIVLTASAVIVDGLPHAEWSWRLVLLFLYSGLIGTALAYWAMSMVNKSISALTTALGTTATPLVGIASAAVLLGEPIDISLAVAAGLIVAGIGLATLGDRLLRRQAAASG
ncbi:DMT family transporter [Bradyrhizobium diazoefficiens]|uniref:DMT family transporter n=1 Tax=Bradyrhizobium diazoefficiens TaxID=1355477 RepID=UPI001FEEDBDD